MTIHKDVEYHVSETLPGEDSISFVTSSPDGAAMELFKLIVSRGRARLDVVIYSKAGAKAFGGEDAVARYLEDPGASVFERYTFSANNEGRVP